MNTKERIKKMFADTPPYFPALLKQPQHYDFKVQITSGNGDRQWVSVQLPTQFFCNGLLKHLGAAIEQHNYTPCDPPKSDEAFFVIE